MCNCLHHNCGLKHKREQRSKLRRQFPLAARLPSANPNFFVSPFRSGRLRIRNQGRLECIEDPCNLISPREIDWDLGCRSWNPGRKSKSVLVQDFYFKIMLSRCPQFLHKHTMFLFIHTVYYISKSHCKNGENHPENKVFYKLKL